MNSPARSISWLEGAWRRNVDDTRVCPFANPLGFNGYEYALFCYVRPQSTHRDALPMTNDSTKLSTHNTTQAVRSQQQAHEHEQGTSTQPHDVNNIPKKQRLAAWAVSPPSRSNPKRNPPAQRAGGRGGLCCKFPCRFSFISKSRGTMGVAGSGSSQVVLGLV
jgi:hypothetical protein